MHRNLFLLQFNFQQCMIVKIQVFHTGYSSQLFFLWICAASRAATFHATVPRKLANKTSLLFYWNASMMEVATDSSFAFSFLQIRARLNLCG